LLYKREMQQYQSVPGLFKTKSFLFGFFFLPLFQQIIDKNILVNH